MFSLLITSFLMQSEAHCFMAEGLSELPRPPIGRKYSDIERKREDKTQSEHSNYLLPQRSKQRREPQRQVVTGKTQEPIFGLFV